MVYPFHHTYTYCTIASTVSHYYKDIIKEIKKIPVERIVCSISFSLFRHAVMIETTGFLTVLIVPFSSYITQPGQAGTKKQRYFLLKITRKYLVRDYYESAAYYSDVGLIPPFISVFNIMNIKMHLLVFDITLI